MTRLASLFSDGAVLQRGRSNPVWGWDRPGQKMTLQVEGVDPLPASQVARTDASGAFRFECPELPTGGPYRLRVRGSSECVIDDVLVGDVWLASGQSNMEWKVAVSARPEIEMAEGRWPELRMFNVDQVAASNPQAQVGGKWQKATSETVGDFSAVGYYFARELHRALAVPVGVINSTWGGTRVEAWTSLETPGLAPAPEEKNAGRALFHGMIAPLVPFGLRGVIWYQGESNADRHWEYCDRFRSLIRDWRAQWASADLPFYFVQLAGFVESIAWAYLREAQSQALAEPATGMAVAIDIGDPADIHPRNKQEVGRRLALLALARTYGRTDLECSGPEVDRVAIDGPRVRIQMSHSAGMRARDGRALRGFALAGPDRIYRTADARIEGDAVVVTCAAVPVPTSVRYAWADHPDANLENAAGLPAAPFRTDRDPLPTR